MEKDTYFLLKKGFPDISAADIAVVKYPYIHFTRQYTEYILYYILSGDLYLKEGNREYHLEKNDYIILDPTRKHGGTLPSDSHFLYVHFMLPGRELYISEEEARSLLGMEEGVYQTGMEIRQKTDGILLPKQYRIKMASGIMECERLIHEIRIARQQPGIYEKQKEEGLFWQLLLELGTDFTRHLREQNTPMRSKAQQLIPGLLSFLNQSYGMDISGELLQEEFNYNFDYLNRLFKRYTGQTIFGYLNFLRIERAKQLLSTGFYSIEEIAENTGFRDMYYFSRVFKKYTGITPGKYRDGR